jgi:hypothetical protein
MTLHPWQAAIDSPSPQPFSQSPVLSTLTGLYYEQGEKRLMLAVLIDAIDSIARYQSGQGAHSWGDCREALQWVLAHERGWLFSFENICTTLDIDSVRLRAALQAEFPMLFFTASHANTSHQKVSASLQPVRG